MTEDMVAELTMLKHDMAKLKAMLLFHDERLDDLEAAKQTKGGGGDKGGGEGGAGGGKRKKR